MVDSLLIVTPIIGFCNCYMFCYFISILVLGKRERELDALLSLSS